MIPATSRPRLAPKARLRDDKQTGGTLLLYPEAGLALNATSADILRRCDGKNTLAGIVEELRRRYAAADPGQVEQDVQALLQKLLDKGLVVIAP